ALSRNASSPPRCSTERSALAEMRSFTVRPSTSEISDTLSRLGRKRRLVRLMAWLTLLPTITPLPVNSQRRAILKFLSKQPDGGQSPAAGLRSTLIERFHRETGLSRQAERPQTSRERLAPLGKRRQFGLLPRFAPPGAGFRARGSELASFRLLPAFAATLLLAASAGAARADTSAAASYVINLGGNIIATASFKFDSAGGNYTLGLNANAFDLITHSDGQEFKVQVQYAGGDVTAFVVTPPIVNNINRVPIERSQLTGVTDMLAAFILKGPKLDRTLCEQHAHIFTGIERFDLDFSYAKDDTATSPRTGYQG